MGHSEKVLVPLFCVREPLLCEDVDPFSGRSKQPAVKCLLIAGCDRLFCQFGGSGGKEGAPAHGGCIVAGEVGHGRFELIVVQQVE